jgi:hypothetical protein
MGKELNKDREVKDEVNFLMYLALILVEKELQHLNL